MARLDVFVDEYMDPDGGTFAGAIRVGGTVNLIPDGDLIAVVDPGMVSARAAILDPLAVNRPGFLGYFRVVRAISDHWNSRSWEGVGPVAEVYPTSASQDALRTRLIENW